MTRRGHRGLLRGRSIFGVVRFGAASVAVVAAALSVRRRGFLRIDTMLREPPESPAARPGAARGWVVAINRVKRHGIYRGNCLSRSIALMWFLRRAGLSPVLRLGARMTSGVLEAHAWVELDGVVLNDTSDVSNRFSPFTETAAGGQSTISRNLAAFARDRS